MRRMTSLNAYRFLWEAVVGGPIPPWRELQSVTSCGKDKPETTMAPADLLVRDNAARCIENAHDTVASAVVEEDDANHRTAAGIALSCDCADTAARRPHSCSRPSAAHPN